MHLQPACHSCTSSLPVFHARLFLTAWALAVPRFIAAIICFPPSPLCAACPTKSHTSCRLSTYLPVLLSLPPPIPPRSPLLPPPLSPVSPVRWRLRRPWTPPGTWPCAIRCLRSSPTAAHRAPQRSRSHPPPASAPWRPGGQEGGAGGGTACGGGGVRRAGASDDHCSRVSSRTGRPQGGVPPARLHCSCTSRPQMSTPPWWPHGPSIVRGLKTWTIHFKAP